MTRTTRNALLGIGGLATFGLIPAVYRWLHPRPARRPRLSTVLGAIAAPTRNAPLLEEEEATELALWRKSA